MVYVGMKPTPSGGDKPKGPKPKPTPRRKEGVNEYREWLEFECDLAEDAKFMFEKETPNEIAATRADYQERAFEKALKRFNEVFPNQ